MANAIQGKRISLKQRPRFRTDSAWQEYAEKLNRLAKYTASQGVKLGYPFVESIRSVLPIVDEFGIALGPSPDGTEEQLLSIGDPKIRILHTQWNEKMRSDYSIKQLKGSVYCVDYLYAISVRE